MFLFFFYFLFILHVSGQPGTDQTGMPSQCQPGGFTTINDPTRRVTSTPPTHGCDSGVINANVWYYFGGDTGWGYLPTSATPTWSNTGLNYCGLFLG